MKKLFLITAVTVWAIFANAQNYCRVYGNATFNTLYDHNPGLVTFDSTGTLHPLNYNGNANTVLSGAGTFISIPSSGWSLTGNAGTNSATNFFGTTDNEPIAIKIGASYGLFARKNIFLGYKAGDSTNCTGIYNVGIGDQALEVNTTGTQNTAIGAGAVLASNTTGSYNTAIGENALDDNIVGNFNTAVGNHSLSYTDNAATGSTFNTAVGAYSGYNNWSGNYNTYIGCSAGYNVAKNATGNTLLGSDAGINAHSSYNTVLGDSAGMGIYYGGKNTLLGTYANILSNAISNATAIGDTAIADSSNSMIFGNKHVIRTGFHGALEPYYNSAYQYGTLGQVLTSQGADAAPKWTTPGGSGIGNWQKNGNNIYYTGGNIGIGTSTPNYPVQIVGDVVDSGSIFATNIAASNSLSIGTIKIVNGVVDSITSQAALLKLNATTINASGLLTAQTLTAGYDSSAITLNGTTGAITSPSGTVGFANNNVITTGAIRGGNLKVSGDSVTMSGIVTDTTTDLMGIDIHGNVVPLSVNTVNTIMNNTAPFNPDLPCSSYTGVTAIWRHTKSPSGGGYNANWVSPCTLVGVGIETPDAALTLDNANEGHQFSIAYTNGSGVLTDAFTIDHTGNTYTAGQVGIGTTTPNAQLDIEGAASGTTGLLVGAGNVVIGSGLTTPGSYNLYVGNSNGTGGILTSLVKIALPSDGVNWSDYVFAKDYKLKPLTEVAKYINDNKHLPDVPSATDVQKDGINVADMDATLLKKIEELTLYMIQQQKLSEEQQKEIQELKAQLEAIKKNQK